MANNSSSVDGPPDQEAVDAKIMADLRVVEEKMDLCDNLMENVAAGAADDVETLMQVVGFLDACVPRMIELVEAAAQGALGEQVLMQCLSVNDRLQKTLETFDKGNFGSPADASCKSASAAASSPTDPFAEEDLFLNDTSADFKPAATASSAGVVSSAADLFRAEEPDRTAAAPGLKKTNSEDEFDSFFNERTTK